MRGGSASSDRALTPRESEVLELMRVGLNDEQIASQLDISLAGIRFYVSQVVSKLGVPSREAAVKWRPAEAPTTRERLVAALRRPPLPRLTLVRGAIATVLLVVIGLYAWGLFFYGNDKPAAPALDVQWLQVDPPFPELRESPRPYASSVLEGAADAWRIYLVEGGGQPRLLLETARRASSTLFSADGSTALIAALSQTQTGEPLAAYVSLSLQDGSTSWERVLPSSANSRLSREAGWFAFTGTPRGSGSREVYVVDPGGTSRQLVGRFLYGSLGAWSPDGRMLLLGAFVSGDTSARYYALAPFEDSAIELGFFRVAPAWSPDGKKLAGFESSDLVIFDLEAKASKRVALGQRIEGASLGQLATGPSWSNDGRFLAASGTVVETSTGRVLYQHQADSVATSISPEGEWAVVSSTGTACGGPARTSSRNPTTTNRTLAVEVATNRTVDLLACGDGYYGTLRWLSRDTVLVSGTTCTSGCSAPAPLSVVLASLPEGRVRHLTDPGGEPLAGFAASPDGERVLVGGRSLRLYSSGGNLLRRIDVPAGLYATGLSWAPDGRSFAYVVGPAVSANVP